MGYKNLEYIVEIARQRNISKAAERLFISQSALSVHLKKLERELGVSLFIRRNNTMIPTTEGEWFVTTAKEILKLEQELYTKINRGGGEKDVFSIGICSEMAVSIFTRVLSDMKKEYPGFRVRIIDGRTDVLITKLNEGLVKCIIIPATQEFPGMGLQGSLLKKERLVFVLARKHPLAHLASDDYENPRKVDASIFQNEKFILAPPDTLEGEMIRRLFHDYHMNPEILFETNRTQDICRILEDGKTVSIQPEFCVPRDMRLVVCTPEHAYYRYMHLVYRNNTNFSVMEKQLLRAVKQAYVHWYSMSGG